MAERILSFLGSAWERNALEALPRVAVQSKHERLLVRQAEPPRQLVPRQSLGTSVTGERSRTQKPIRERQICEVDVHASAEKIRIKGIN